MTKHRPDLEIGQYLVISTAHLPARWFHSLANLPTASFAYDDGIMLWVPDDIDDDLVGSPEYAPANDVDIIRLRRFARAHNCNFVRLDADGPIVADLPTFEWPDGGYTTEGGDRDERLRTTD